MFGNPLNAEFETRSLASDRPGAGLAQLRLYGLHNLLRRHGKVQRPPLNVDHAVREEQVWPDTCSFSFLREQVYQPVIDDIGEQAAYLAQLMIAKDQLVIAEFLEDGRERSRLAVPQNCRGGGYKIGDVVRI